MTLPRITCTVRAALEASGLGRTKLNELLASGRLESVKIDGRRLIVWASLERLLASGPTPGSGPAKGGRGRTGADSQHHRR
jgi:hypothetical protein